MGTRMLTEEEIASLRRKAVESSEFYKTRLSGLREKPLAKKKERAVSDKTDDDAAIEAAQRRYRECGPIRGLTLDPRPARAAPAVPAAPEDRAPRPRPPDLETAAKDCMRAADGVDEPARSALLAAADAMTAARQYRGRIREKLDLSARRTVERLESVAERLDDDAPERRALDDAAFAIDVLHRRLDLARMEQGAARRARDEAAYWQKSYMELQAKQAAPPPPPEPVKPAIRLADIRALSEEAAEAIFAEVERNGKPALIKANIADVVWKTAGGMLFRKAREAKEAKREGESA